MKDKNETSGILDLGGASTQILFVPKSLIYRFLNIKFTDKK
jgi:hypothetical protein